MTELQGPLHALIANLREGGKELGAYKGLY